MIKNNKNTFSATPMYLMLLENCMSVKRRQFGYHVSGAIGMNLLSCVNIQFHCLIIVLCNINNQVTLFFYFSVCSSKMFTGTLVSFLKVLVMPLINFCKKQSAILSRP